MTSNVYLHAGDMGDVIAALPTMKVLGLGKLIICPPVPSIKNPGRESLRGTRFSALRPLLEAQSYLTGVEWTDDAPSSITHDFTNFRQGYINGESLADWQARYMSVKVTAEPWLTARRSGESIGRTIIARSTRYQNPGFPWFAVLGKFKDILFVGLKEEYDKFMEQHRVTVEFRPTKDLLELAELINGCSQFVGNQSCPFWIAAGLGVPIIQEGWPHSPNSQIHRKNTRYLIRGPFQI